MKEEDYSKSIEVFSGSPWEAEIIKGLLESNDIRCVIKDGIMGRRTVCIFFTSRTQIDTGSNIDVCTFKYDEGSHLFYL